ncbi:hypothetical protein [Variovorax sp. PAMC26660]|uniref:hypothetical protein n=1 Tax=Variovorax sp. PAMC26660 TaxID=2762322 RepID=UPI00164D2F21|nr:hypothetical protein [Variovorax sp. PAMC26660]QNK65750.1 hypothetical protein H7F35_21335 [Variovorax sp. PAMC26660]
MTAPQAAPELSTASRPEAVTAAETKMLQYLFSNMSDLSDGDWRHHGFRLSTFTSLERKLLHILAARAAPGQALTDGEAL